MHKFCACFFFANFHPVIIFESQNFSSKKYCETNFTPQPIRGLENVTRQLQGKRQIYIHLYKMADVKNPRLQLQRTGLSSLFLQLTRQTGPSSWFVELVHSVGLSSLSVQLVCLADPFSSSVQLICLTCSMLNALCTF